MDIDRPVQEVMSPRVITADIGDSLVNIAKEMIKYDRSSAVVTEDGKPVGIITERDISRKIIPDDRKPSTVSLSELMTSPLIIVDQNTPVSTAIQMMLSNKIRRLPVFRNDTLVGIVTSQDIVAVSSEMSDTLRELMESEGESLLTSDFEGICDACGQYSYHLAVVDGRSLCDDCKDLRWREPTDSSHDSAYIEG
uniref:Inosine-5'-monophosphate dehydrogenase n=1 Tax=Candidatus Methanogaster sp. ANME-2c ERB4 TaxID=2759911 RepID=A0A7G9YPV2_9EURY|nr:inosine-5'-monophosphate dehydrogenase [Methanosarcinales archaeon ANME-2c ERB4]